MPTVGSRKVAVVGARGIGKHHAKWWALEGADVCAVVGTSEETLRQTVATLGGMFNFQGRAYTDMQTMLLSERPEIVDVCSPPALHLEHAEAALRNGCHVLCEKPFHDTPGQCPEDILSRARETVELAESRGLLLGVCAQYVVAGKTCLELVAEHADKEGVPLSAFHAHLASPARDRPVDANAAWTDLSPHLFAALEAIVPSAELVPGSVTAARQDNDTEARFTLRAAHGNNVSCDLRTGRTTGTPAHIRHVRLNDCRIDIEGFRNDAGIFRARYDTPFGSFERMDMMQTLMREFLAGNALVPGRTALRHLEWALEVRQAPAP